MDKLRLTFSELLMQLVDDRTGNSSASHLSNKISMHTVKLLTILSSLECISNENSILATQNWTVQGIVWSLNLVVTGVDK